MTDAIPNPGSDAALDMGCTCPVMSNGHGRGYHGDENLFIYDLGCPIHATGPIARFWQSQQNALDERADAIADRDGGEFAL